MSIYDEVRAERARTPDRTAPDALVERLAAHRVGEWRTLPSGRHSRHCTCGVMLNISDIDGSMDLHRADILVPTVEAYATEVAEAAVAARLAGVEALITRAEAGDLKMQEREPEDWRENREHYFRRYGVYPELTVRVTDLRAALHPGGDEGSDGPRDT